MNRTLSCISLLILVFLTLPLPGRAQNTLVVESVDKSRWPLLTANIYLLDEKGEPINDVDQGKMVVTENALPRSTVSLTCPTSEPDGQVSSILSIDISGSMARSATPDAPPNIELARKAALAWINGLPDRSECGITSFDINAFVLTELTNDRNRLRSVLSRLYPNSGTDYKAGLLSTPAGALPLLEGGKHRRVVIFLTDGLSEVNPDPIIAEAKRLNAMIFCVTLGMRAPDVLKQIAEETGGAWFENVTSEAEAEAIYRAILYKSRGGKPCQLTWQSEQGCDPVRNVVLTYDKRLVSHFDYYAPDLSIPLVSVSPTTLLFDSTATAMNVTISAPGAPVTISRIEELPGEEGFDLDIPSLPINLASGESRTLTVTRRPGTSPSAISRWRIESTCYPSSIVVWGNSEAREAVPLRLTSPNGGEVFNAGENALITWDGVPEHIPVRLEYSINAGKTWMTVAEGVSGGVYSWKVPGTPSDQCLARVSLINNGAGLMPIATLPVKRHLWSLNPEEETIAGYLGDTTMTSARGRRLPAGTFGLWDTRTGNLLKTWSVVGDPTISYKEPTPTVVEYDPTGRYILCGNYMMDARTGEVLWWKDGANAHAYDYLASDRTSPSFSPDGNQVLLRISQDGGEVLGIIESKTGRVITSVGNPQLGISTGIFSPLGDEVLTSSREGAIIWDAQTGSRRTRLTNRSIFSATYSRSGKYIVALPANSDSLYVWTRAPSDLSGKPIYAGNDINSYRAAGFAPDETGLVVWKNRRPEVIDLHTDNVITTYGDLNHSSSRGMRLEYSQDGGMAAAIEPATLPGGSGGRRVAIYDTKTGSLLATDTAGGSMVGTSLGFAPDRSRIVWSYGYDVVIGMLSAQSGSDESDDLWTIIGKADPEFVDIDFGDQKVGTLRDSVVVGFLENRGDAGLRVSDINIVEGNRTDFALVSPLPPFDIPPGTSRTVEFRFAPTAQGPRSSIALMETDIGKLSARLTGNGIDRRWVLATDVIDFGTRETGNNHDTLVLPLFKTLGTGERTDLNITSAKLEGPNEEDFTMLTSLEGTRLREDLQLSLRFRPDTTGLFSGRILLTLSDGEKLSVPVYGRGSGTGGERYPDPTTFRTVAVPNAVIPPAGTVVLGSYDLLGLMGGYAFTDNIMLLAGGAPPLPDDWGGTNGSAFGAYSIGLKGNLKIADEWLVAAGAQWAASFSEKEETPEPDSRIIAPTLYGSVSYGNDDRRISLTGGYTFKRHTTLVEPSTGLIDRFPREAGIISLGGDWRIGDRWKVAAEGVYMGTVGIAPIITTARWFGRTWALDFGAAWLLIETGEGEAPSIPVAPVVSFVWTYR